eukprot:scaffold117170_cov30-Phaeocystis_antarctica.AAC.1
MRCVVLPKRIPSTRRPLGARGYRLDAQGYRLEARGYRLGAEGRRPRRLPSTRRPCLEAGGGSQGAAAKTPQGEAAKGAGAVARGRSA